MFSIFVTINIKPGRAAEFSRASLGDAEGSVRDEPGCFRFDILADLTNANRFYLFEVYRDRAAFEDHLKAPHFMKWRAEVQAMFDGEPTRIEMSTVFPSDAGWERQKPGLLHW